MAFVLFGTMMIGSPEVWVVLARLDFFEGVELDDDFFTGAEDEDKDFPEDAFDGCTI